MRSLLALAILVVLAAPVAGQEVPYLAGRVNDLADMLPAGAEGRLEARLEALETETGAQVVVLTTRTLGGGNLEDFAFRVAETWQLGRADQDDGVLFLIVRDDRKMRLEVGYGLEGALPDAICRRILDNVCRPRFRAGDFEGGVEASLDLVDRRIRGEAVEPPQAAPARRGSGGIAGLFALFVLAPFVLSALFAPSPAGWVVGGFLSIFWFVIGVALLTVLWGLGFVAIWLFVLVLVRIVFRRPLEAMRESAWWGGIADAWSSSGGWSSGSGGWSGGGGGFSGGGGSFGGGGASSSW